MTGYDSWKTREDRDDWSNYERDMAEIDAIEQEVDNDLFSLEDSLAGSPETEVELGCWSWDCRCIACRLADERFLNRLADSYATDRDLLTEVG